MATFFGFISSSCSFAALAASRSVLVKGAHPANSLAFLISSTNLVIELGIVLWVLLGWRFTLANILLGLLMVLYAYGLTALWFPSRLAEEGRRHAEKAQKAEGMDMEHGMAGNWRDKLTSREGWRQIAHAFFMEWAMVWKEILFGFTIAGFISVFVPQSFWDFLFDRVPEILKESNDYSIETQPNPCNAQSICFCNPASYLFFNVCHLSTVRKFSCMNTSRICK